MKPYGWKKWDRCLGFVPKGSNRSIKSLARPDQANMRMNAGAEAIVSIGRMVLVQAVETDHPAANNARLAAIVAARRKCRPSRGG